MIRVFDKREMSSAAAALRADAEDILADLAATEHEDWAVNWADLSVVQVVVGEDDLGDTVAAVWIEEASPNSPLAQAVVEKLRKRWGCDLVVETAW